MENPILTIIICSYNYGDFLATAIESVLHEKFSSFEILIIEDCSTDQSPSIVKQYAEKYSCIRVIWHEKNKGLFETVNESISEAKGKYVHILSADDYRLPGFIEKTMEILLKNPDLGFCCSDFGYVVKKEKTADQLISQKLIKNVHSPIIFKPHEIIKVFQNTSFWVAGSSTIVKKELLIKYGKFKPELKFHCDLFLFYNIAMNESFAYIPETLSVLVMHAKSYGEENEAKNLQVNREIYRYLLNFLFLSENKRMRYDFMKATVLHTAFETLGKKQFIFKPKYWPFFFYFFMKYLRRRKNKIFRKKFNPLECVSKL